MLYVVTAHRAAIFPDDVGGRLVRSGGLPLHHALLTPEILYGQQDVGTAAEPAQFRRLPRWTLQLVEQPGPGVAIDALQVTGAGTQPESIGGNDGFHFHRDLPSFGLKSRRTRLH